VYESSMADEGKASHSLHVTSRDFPTLLSKFASTHLPS
jgi:hypothetical protein